MPDAARGAPAAPYRALPRSYALVSALCFAHQSLYQSVYFAHRTLPRARHDVHHLCFAPQGEANDDAALYRAIAMSPPPPPPAGEGEGRRRQEEADADAELKRAIAMSMEGGEEEPARALPRSTAPCRAPTPSCRHCALRINHSID